MRNVISTLAIWLLLAHSGTAEEFGRIEATLDGEPRLWYTILLSQGSRTDASATFSTSRLTSDLHIQGHPRPAFTSTDVLSVDAGFRGEIAPGATPLALEIMHLPEGMAGPIWTSQGVPVAPSIDIEALEVAESGSIGSLIAKFSGQLCFQASITDDLDPSRCKGIEGRFETRLLFE